MNNVRALRSNFMKSIGYNKNSSSQEQTVALQIVDLSAVKYSGVKSGDIVVGDEVHKAIDVLIEGYIWIYEQGYSGMATFSADLSDEHLAKYDEIKAAFAVFNNFMRLHMHLVE